MTQNIFTSSGIRKINTVIDDQNVDKIRTLWQDHVKTIPTYPSFTFEGKGIVMCAGGIRYFTCAWVAIKNLRRLGCTLPIEVWYYGNEISDEAVEQLQQLNAICKNFLDFGHRNVQGFLLKPLAILHSQFKEVLFIDADNNCISNPQSLFYSDEYLEYGCIFWPDYWRTDEENPIWKITESKDYHIPEQESGQILINKETCWREMNLCLFLNLRQDIFYRMLYGDKDTFKFAWIALKSKFYMIKKETATCGYYNVNHEFLGTTMVQHGLDGNALFLHRNLLKWDVTKQNEKFWQSVRSFSDSATNRVYEICLQQGEHSYMRLRGDIEEHTPAFLSNYEDGCLEILKELRNSAFYGRFLLHTHIATSRFDMETKFDWNA